MMLHSVAQVQRLPALPYASFPRDQDPAAYLSEGHNLSWSDAPANESGSGIGSGSGCACAPATSAVAHDRAIVIATAVDDHAIGT